MKQYHKIHTIFKRDPATKHKTLIEGDYSLPEFEYLANNDWVFTEKVDGTNIRAMFDGTQFSIGGKTDKASLPTQLTLRLNERFVPQVNVLKEMFPDGACLYGEGYGHRIQKGGGKYRSDQDFVLFDVKIGEWWLQRPDVEEIAAKLGLDVVPIIGRGTLFEMVEMVRKPLTSTWGDFTAEGIVGRPATELQCRNGARLITKIKHKDFAS